MRSLVIVSAISAALALAACSKAEQADTEQDVKAAADKVAAETHDAITSPEVKEVGAEIKEAAGNAVTIGKGAVAGAKDAMNDVKAEEAAEAGTTTTEVTTTTTTTKTR